jgi:hypothetical protein
MTMKKRGRLRQSVPQQESLRPQCTSEGPLRTPTSHYDAHVGKDSYVVVLSDVVMANVICLGVPYYHIHWEGMPSESDTREHASNLQDSAS